MSKRVEACELCGGAGYITPESAEEDDDDGDEICPQCEGTGIGK